MEIRHPDSFDPIAKALACVDHVIGDRTEDHPLTPELFWTHLRQDGFEIYGRTPDPMEASPSSFTSPSWPERTTWVPPHSSRE